MVYSRWCHRACHVLWLRLEDTKLVECHAREIRHLQLGLMLILRYEFLVGCDPRVVKLVRHKCNFACINQF